MRTGCIPIWGNHHMVSINSLEDVGTNRWSPSNFNGFGAPSPAPSPWPLHPLRIPTRQRRNGRTCWSALGESEKKHRRRQQTTQRCQIWLVVSTRWKYESVGKMKTCSKHTNQKFTVCHSAPLCSSNCRKGSLWQTQQVAQTEPTNQGPEECGRAMILVPGGCVFLHHPHGSHGLGIIPRDDPLVNCTSMYRTRRWR